jgi:hypothetical protein
MIEKAARILDPLAGEQSGPRGDSDADQDDGDAELPAPAEGAPRTLPASRPGVAAGGAVDDLHSEPAPTREP